MEPQRRTFCAPYQMARQIRGVPGCWHTRATCPFGLHACSECGRPGHGAEDCRFTTMPPSEEVAPTPTPPLPPPPPAPAARSGVFVPGFGVKGEGKKGNYGVLIPPPSSVDAADLPSDAVEAPSKKAKPENPPSPVTCPPPIAATTEEVEQWIAETFRPLNNLSLKTPPEIGESILWRGVKTGPRGNPSTKVEFFNAKVRHVGVEDDEIYIYVD